MKNTRKIKKYFLIGFAIYLYVGVVLIFAMPLHYGSATVVNTNPIEIKMKKEVIKQEIKPPVVKILPVQRVESNSIAYYKDIAREEAENYDLDVKMFQEIINCESGYDPTASHDGGNGKGITGFWRETFQRWNKKFFGGELDYHKQEDQIKLMARAFAEGEQYRDDWSSWNKYKKYGVCFNYQIRKIQAKKTKNG